MKICDLTQFYSPLSGGVKRYLHEKIDYIEAHSPRDEHLLIVPGARTEKTVNGRSTIFAIHSPLVSLSARYRALLNLRALEEIVTRERPDIIESSDPYQIGWKALACGRTLNIPVVAFYHSHFPEAYLRGASRFLGRAGSRAVMNFSARYVRDLYNQFEATLVPSSKLMEVLREWGVQNLREVKLGVNTGIFHPRIGGEPGMRISLGVASDQKMLLYVGRLAPEKNTSVLFTAFDVLEQKRPGDFHLVVVGDGPGRAELQKLQDRADTAVSWIPYCADASELARYYRAADLFVHPGVQETFGLVALESQACGTPVLGIRGANMMIFHEQDSWASENNPESLADAIETFGAKDLPSIGDGASRAARERFSWRQAFDEQFCIYREVCARYRRS